MNHARATRWVAATPLVFALAATTAGACTPKLTGEMAGRIENARFVVAFRVAPARLKAGQPLRLEVAVCAKDAATAAERVEVDARMPAHGHGMNYKPMVSQVTTGLFHAEGLLLHMPGAWELIIEVSANGRTDRLVAPLTVE